MGIFNIEQNNGFVLYKMIPENYKIITRYSPDSSIEDITEEILSFMNGAYAQKRIHPVEKVCILINHIKIIKQSLFLHFCWLNLFFFQKEEKEEIYLPSTTLDIESAIPLSQNVILYIEIYLLSY